MFQSLSSNSGLDLIDEFEHMSKPKKKRPNLPRPPRAAAASTHAAKVSSSQFTTPQVDSNAFEFQSETANSSSTSSSTTGPLEGSQNNPISLLDEEPARRSKVTYRRSNSAMAAVASAGTKASPFIEENLHPNDDKDTLSSSFGTRRSSRLEKKARRNITGLSSFSDNETATTVTTRSRARAKKRSATCDMTNGFGIPSDQELATTSLASFSSESFSVSSNSSIRGNESFSSLARSSTNWANKKSSQHDRSVSVASFSNNDDSGKSTLKTPGVISKHNRSISCGGDLSSVGNAAFGLSSFLSPEKGGTNHSTTPSVSSTASRKRRNMDFTSSPLNDEELGASEFMLDHAISELAPTSSMMGPSSEPAIEKSVNDDEMCLVGSDDEVNEKQDDMRDRLSLDNDESMMSTGSDDNESNTSTSVEEYEDAEEDETPREMTDAEVFQCMSSYDDFKFLTKSLKKWSQSSTRKGASMGLNNGCLIAVPPSWTFEHRANFAKWVAVAFGFRIGNVGGAGSGSFLRCSDTEGKEALARLLRILNDYKADRLALPSTETNVASTKGHKKAPPPSTNKPKSK